MTKIVVTGSGRCGTGYVAQVLTGAGIPCGHEVVYHPAVVLDGHPVEWGAWHADSSWIAAATPPEPGTVTVAVVRHPLEVVQSQLAIDSFGATAPRNVWEAVTAKATPAAWEHPAQHDRALAHWTAWNEMALARADLFVLLDDLNGSVVAAVAALAGVTLAPSRQPIDALPARVNTKADQRRPVAALRAADFDTGLAAAACELWAEISGDWRPW